MKEKHVCPYCGEEYNKPAEYFKADTSPIVLSKMTCSACNKNWVEIGLENPIYQGYLALDKQEVIEGAEDIVSKYKPIIFQILNSN